MYDLCGRHEQTDDTELILASASPRRRQLLAFLGLPFRVKPSPLDEKTLRLSGPPARRVMDSAKAKALSIALTEKRGWVLAADTVVCIDGMILGKPADREEARDMLRLLSGKSHVVTTGVCLCPAGGESAEPIFEETRVWIAALSDRQIDGYIGTGEPMDKAGAYGIQGFGAVLVPRIEGCYYNVMGLPLSRTAALLTQAGVGTRAGAGAGLFGREKAGGD